MSGSTRLLQALGDRYPALLDQHARVMRAAIAAGDGIEIGTEGLQGRGGHRTGALARGTGAVRRASGA